MFEIHTAGHGFTTPTGRVADTQDEAIAQAHEFVIGQSKAHCGWCAVAVVVNGQTVYTESAYRGETFKREAA